MLEGYHPVKHALRFAAELAEVVVAAGTPADSLPEELRTAGVDIREVPDRVVDQILGVARRVPVLARAARRPADPRRVLAGADRAPVVVLERPTHLGNLGAAVRVAAAAGAAGVIAAGDADPWAPAAVRGAAGLQYALPVARAESGWVRLHPRPSSSASGNSRPVVAVDPGGVPLGRIRLPVSSVLAFGTERQGISDELRERADLLVRIPMRPGVSSLNLATAVAVVLYTLPGAFDRAADPPRNPSEPGAA